MPFDKCPMGGEPGGPDPHDAGAISHIYATVLEGLEIMTNVNQTCKKCTTWTVGIHLLADILAQSDVDGDLLENEIARTIPKAVREAVKEHRAWYEEDDDV